MEIKTLGDMYIQAENNDKLVEFNGTTFFKNQLVGIYSFDNDKETQYLFDTLDNFVAVEKNNA